MPYCERQSFGFGGTRLQMRKAHTSEGPVLKGERPGMSPMWPRCVWVEVQEVEHRWRKLIACGQVLPRQRTGEELERSPQLVMNACCGMTDSEVIIRLHSLRISARARKTYFPRMGQASKAIGRETFEIFVVARSVRKHVITRYIPSTIGTLIGASDFEQGIVGRTFLQSRQPHHDPASIFIPIYCCKEDGH